MIKIATNPPSLLTVLRREGWRVEGFNLELGEAHFRKEGHQLETAAKQNRLLTSNILLLTTHPGNQSFIKYIKQHKLKKLKWLGWLLFPPEHKT